MCFRYKDGEQLASAEGCLFFESSSKQARTVVEAMEAVARRLAEREDKQMEDVLRLNLALKKKKACCEFWAGERVPFDTCAFDTCILFVVSLLLKWWYAVACFRPFYWWLLLIIELRESSKNINKKLFSI